MSSKTTPRTILIKRISVAMFCAFAIVASGMLALTPFTPVQQAEAAVTYTAHKWSYSKYPLYYKVRGKAKATSISVGKIKTSKLDSRGRTRSVTAKVTYSMVAKSAGWREDMTGLTCSGWGNNKKVTIKLSNGTKYRGYGWNRSHLLADCLGGHAVRRNIICGTRTQNAGNNDADAPGGMMYSEALARNYLYAHKDGWVYYKATPVYKGSELIPRSVYVDIKSNDGSINQHVEVFNAMRGYKINYKTGVLTKKTSSAGSEPTYVYVTRYGKKYHRAGCIYLTPTKSKVTLAAAKESGRTACKACF